MRDPSHIKDEVYLGDGLYVRYDGFLVWLRAPRDKEDHVVGLEPPVLEELEDYLKSLKEDLEYAPLHPPEQD